MSEQAFAFAAVSATLWGIFFGWSVRQWWAILGSKVRTRREVVVGFRRLLTSWCLFVLPFASAVFYILEANAIGTEAFRGLAFFTFAGSYIVGGLYAVVSLKFD